LEPQLSKTTRTKGDRTMADTNETVTPSSVSVEIYDQVYHLRGVDQEYIHSLASLVDGKMRAVSAHGATVDSLRVAVLAALNIADELLEMRQRQQELLGSLGQTETDMRHRAGSLSGLLDEVLSERIAV